MAEIKVKDKVVIRKRYDARVRVVTPISGVSRTKQAFKDECDINNILDRYQKTGIMTHVAGRPPGFGDFTGVDDYQSALNKVIEAQASFETLPSKVRARFRNDPGEFLAFVSDPRNTDELVAMGLATKKDVQPPVTPQEPPAKA